MVNCSFLSNYADDNTLYTIGDSNEEIKEILRKDFETLSNWFYDNYMILNPSKCHYMFLGKNNTTSNNEFIFNNITMPVSEEEIILGVTIDNKLTFAGHIRSLCRRASQKLAALLRVSNYLDFDKRRLMFNSMIKSQFNYCPLIWMFCSRNSNTMINKVHERSLRVVLNDSSSDFKDILEKANETTIHVRNIQSLMTEIYKFDKGLSPPIVKDLFKTRENVFNIRNFQTFATNTKHTTKYGTETITYRAPQLWNQLPDDIKSSTSLSVFRNKIKSWNFENCPCRLCKKYVANVGFI